MEPKSFHASRASFKVARGATKVTTGQRFYALLTNLKDKQVLIPKHMIIAHTVDILHLIVPTKALLLEFQPDTVPKVN